MPCYPCTQCGGCDWGNVNHNDAQICPQCGHANGLSADICEECGSLLPHSGYQNGTGEADQATVSPDYLY